MLKYGGVSNQIHFGRSEEPTGIKNDQGRTQNKVIDIDP